jgi:ATP-dependent RNA helicase DDX54/DBP10
MVDNEVYDSGSSKLQSKSKSSAGSFQNLGLEKEVLKGILTMGYKIPTPVQRKTLPIALVGMDVVCMARTGSGKTMAFLIPLVQKLKEHEHGKGVRGIVLSPTRELAMQTLRFSRDLAKFTNLRIISIVGGEGIETQYDSLANQPDVLIATPGRLHHHLSEISTFKLKSVQYIVFDEADRLFEMGFAEQINDILRQCPIERQTLLFSATMPKALIQFTRAGLRDPQLVRLDTDVKLSDELRIGFFNVRTHEKIASLLYLVRRIIPKNQSTIIFTATKHHSEFIYMLLDHIGLKCSLVYGSMDQDSRQANLRSFRLGEINYLIVTDLAARGIDIPLINNVINFHFPANPKLFVHRCGRAARQGRIGFAFSIVEPDELPYAVDVHRFLDLSIASSESTFGSLNPMEEETADSRQHGTSTVKYTLDTMLPSQVHMGILPQDLLNEEVEYVKSMLHEHDAIAAAYKVSENAMKQYKRTRTAASHDGVKTTKKLVKEEFIRSIHPLIQGMDPLHCDSTIIAKADYIRMLQTFRPAQTVLETGIGTGSTSNPKLKKKSQSDVPGKDSGIDIMKALRLANDDFLERNRKKLSLVDEDRDTAAVDDHDAEDVTIGAFHEAYSDDDDEHDVSAVDEYDDTMILHDDASVVDNTSIAAATASASTKPRLSIAEKRKLKKRGYSSEDIQQYAQSKALTTTTDYDQKSYRDPKFYMAYGTEDERATYAEESLQPKSGLRSSETQSKHHHYRRLLA